MNKNKHNLIEKKIYKHYYHNDEITKLPFCDEGFLGWVSKSFSTHSAPAVKVTTNFIH
jgi:hypothetical protein